MFNDIAGGSQQLTKADFINQKDIIASEFQELVDGIENDDIVEAVDGVVDVLVTVFGMMQKLENAYGIDFAKACNLIADNNLSKFVVNEREAADTVAMYKAKGIETYYRYDETYNVYVIRNSKTGKVMKPIDFVPVSLVECFPTLQ